MQINKLYSEFTQNTNELISLLSGLTSEQFNKTPFEGSWTVAQIGDHLLQSYGVAEILNGKKEPTNWTENKIDPIREVFLNYDLKMDSPDFIIPSDDFIKKETLIKGLEKRSSFIANYIKSDNDLSLTCLDFELPVNGKLTRVEWIEFMTDNTYAKACSPVKKYY